MIAYASSTRTRRNIAAMSHAGWRLLLTPTNQDTHGLPFAIDNGAWGAHCRGEAWEAEPFLALVDGYGPGADFIVLPDIVAGGRASLDRSATWIPRLDALSPGTPLLLPVQDGMEAADLSAFLFEKIGLFVGGSTAWKLHTLPVWASVARERGVYLHVARVNTARRIRLCQMAGAQSFDGTSVTRYAVTLPELDEARRQAGLWER